jgi:hypothetical protein
MMPGPGLLSPENSAAGPAGVCVARQPTRESFATLRRTMSLEGTFAEDPSFTLAKRVGGAGAGAGDSFPGLIGPPMCSVGLRLGDAACPPLLPH